MKLRTLAAGMFVALFLSVPAISFAADCSALTTQLATLQAQSVNATGLQLQIVNLQIQITLLQIQSCNETTPLPDNGAKGTLTAYLNGSLYYRSESITRSEAIANCKQNGETVAVAVESYYCTWNGEEVYRKGSSEKGGLVAETSSENPLKVTATYVMNEKKSCGGGTYGIYFGDENLKRGQEPQLLHFPADACNSYVQHTEHTYAKAGGYTIALYDLSSKGKVLVGEYKVTVGQSGKSLVTFDKGSYTSATPTLTGKTKGRFSLPFGISIDNGDKVYASGVGAIQPKKGKWSHTITTPLADGTYNARAFTLLNVPIGSGMFSVRAGSTTPSGAASISLVGVSRQEVTAQYSVPAGKSAEIELVNKESGVVIAVYDIRKGGSGTAVIRIEPSSVSSGLYYLELAYGDKPWPKSSTFMLEGTAPTCKVSSESMKGQGTLVTWKSTGATSATSDISGSSTSTRGTVAVNGSRVVTPTSNTVYSFWFEGPGGRATCVSPEVYPSASTTASATIDQSSLTSSSARPVLTGSAQNTSAVLISIKGYVEGPAFVRDGRWSYTVQNDLAPNAYDVQISNRFDGTVLATGRLVVTPVILREPTPSCLVTATPSSVAPKKAVTVTWSSKNASYGMGPGGDKVDANGSATYYPTSTQTYSYTFFGVTGGKTGCSATVRVEPQPELPPVVDTGGVPTPHPIIQLKASPQYLSTLRTTTLSWAAQNATSCALSTKGGTSTSVGINGTKTVSVKGTTTFVLRCENNPGAGREGEAAEASITVYLAEMLSKDQQASALAAIETQLNDIKRQIKELLSR